MTGTRHAAVLGLALILAAAPARAADEPDELVSGTSAIVRYGVIAKFIARGAFDLPDMTNQPTVEGATLSIFDTGSAMTDVYALPGVGWKGLGSPAGSKGWKYKGAGSIPDPCKVVLVKANIVKAVCRGRGKECTCT